MKFIHVISLNRDIRGVCLGSAREARKIKEKVQGEHFQNIMSFSPATEAAQRIAYENRYLWTIHTVEVLK